MIIYNDFRDFCQNLTVNNHSTISSRYKAITKRLNTDFWNISSETNHSYYVGSYGRGTAIRGFSDVDMIFILHSSVYWKYNAYRFNGQSALLQAVKNSIQSTYWNTDVGGDGQVVVVNFSDGTRFEVVPVIKNSAETFNYPDSNDGGRWKTTNPIAEMVGIYTENKLSNGNLWVLCKIMRAWKNKWNVPMNGLLIDTLAFNFMRNWEYKHQSYGFYDWMCRDFFKYMADQDTKQSYWKAPGSNQFVLRRGMFEYKAKQCYNLAKEAINYESKNQYWSYRNKWREIFGTAFPQHSLPSLLTYGLTRQGLLHY